MLASRFGDCTAWDLKSGCEVLGSSGLELQAFGATAACGFGFAV